MTGYAAVDATNNHEESGTAQSKRKETFISRCTEVYASKAWKPMALRAPVLIFTLSLCWTLIAVLQYLLWRSQKDNGIIFAPRINDLPLKQTFLYLYFPTIVAVIFSIYWTWIDLETKRLEPYYQLSKENGARGKDSLLLQYPYDFIPFVPLKAFRDRHWPVFWASFAVVLVTWGLVPTQAGIFSVRTITRTTDISFEVSTHLMPFEKQAESITMRYAQSTYGIAALNETLPPFMARNYTLAPFGPSNISLDRFDDIGTGSYTAPTTMYFLDLYCEDVSHKADGTSHTSYVSSNGCNFTLGLDGNLTIDTQRGAINPMTIRKQYTAHFVGYHNGGFADYYLSSDCPKSANTTFYAALAKSKARVQDPPQDVTAVFCHPRYWQQEVLATVDMHTNAPLSIVATKDKELLPWYALNTTMFETLLNSPSVGNEVRGDTLPMTSVPNYWEVIAASNLSGTVGGGGFAPPMAGLALTMGNPNLEDYLDWKSLSKAYADAYRLMFSRAMVEVLGPSVSSPKQGRGQRHVTVQAVVLEPVFVYIVEAFLGIISIALIALLTLSFLRKRNLKSDPNTTASVMSLVADNLPLLSDFSRLDCCTTEELDRVIGQRRYKLVASGTETSSILEIPAEDGIASETAPLSPREDNTIAKPVRPKEFSLWVALPVISLFIALAVGLGIIFTRARANGLPLPSSNSIVQNILENYIPTAIATLIEPMWILINRLLCLLQPLEQLQDCDARAEKSIDLNYSSLPPQLVMFKALKSKHFVLAAVCTMALFANLLAVSFAGLFNQGLVDIYYPDRFELPHQLKFVPINGSIVPTSSAEIDLSQSGAFKGGDGFAQFLVAESNFSRNTPLPPWTDDRHFYLPAFEDGGTDMLNQSRFEVTTQAIGGELDCKPLRRGNNFILDVRGSLDSKYLQMYMNATVSSKGDDTRCTAYASIRPGRMTPNPNSPACSSGPSSVEITEIMSPLGDATQKDINTCTSTIILAWIRNAQGTCPIGSRNITLTEQNSLFVQCRPRLVSGSARIRVNGNGRLLEPAADITIHNRAAENESNFFSNAPDNLLAQSSGYLFNNYGTTGFHNDSFAGEFINYFMIRSTNSSRLVDPNTAVPTFEEILEPLNKAYSKLFAIWVGSNRKNLLVAQPSGNRAQIEGSQIKSEQRVLVSTTMFIISEAILCTYVLVAVWVYMRRPGQYLARLPTSVASIIALFAASAAATDMRGTSHLNKKQRAQHLKKIDARYGYGSFVGGDGRVHIGVEKTPFVRVRTRTTWLEKNASSLRNRSTERI